MSQRRSAAVASAVESARGGLIGLVGWGTTGGVDVGTEYVGAGGGAGTTYSAWATSTPSVLAYRHARFGPLYSVGYSFHVAVVETGGTALVPYGFDASGPTHAKSPVATHCCAPVTVVTTGKNPQYDTLSQLAVTLMAAETVDPSGLTTGGDIDPW